VFPYLFRTSISIIFEYCATFLFIIALSVARAGIWRADPEWLGHSLREAGKWIVAFTGTAALGGLIGLYADDAKDVLKTTAQTIFNTFIFLFVVYLLYLYGSGEKVKAPRKKRTTQKRRGKRRKPLL
jgi:hypothetical protein